VSAEAASTLGSVRHLVARFFRSLRSSVPTPADESWAAGFLTPAEWELFAAMPPVDRQHALHGARMVERSVPEPFRHDVIEAALVHDVGKRHAQLGVIGRSVATTIGWVVRSDTRRAWLADARGWPGRVGRYLRHDVVGAAEVAAAGGTRLAVGWTADHHHRDRFADLPAPGVVVEALDAADRDF
jgi:hypothetical protein